MKTARFTGALILLCTFCNVRSALAQSQDSVWLFSYFKDNGQDGLHLAYSEDALNWQSLNHDSSLLRPTVANDRLMRDPCIVRGPDGRFHMVWTVSWNDRGIGYASSLDLLHWSKQQFIPVMQQEPEARNCWAPELFYDGKEKQFMIYWATTIPGRFTQGDAAGDDKYNHRLYYTSTKDFKSFTPTRPLYDQGFNVIDATIQRTGKEYLMFLKDETRRPPEKNLRIARSRSLYKGYSPPSPPITGDYWAEGPTVAHVGDRWIVYFDKYTQHSYGAVASTDLVHWEDISGTVHFPAGLRHGTVFRVSRAEFNNLLAGLH
ncbi:MAG: glycoside hydrolase family 43 protein [Bacteroidota bacterium]|nr:glycoside hydrolase family 43 protein [Bacteroidota bacterium]